MFKDELPMLLQFKDFDEILYSCIITNTKTQYISFSTSMLSEEETLSECLFQQMHFITMSTLNGG